MYEVSVTTLSKLIVSLPATALQEGIAEQRECGQWAWVCVHPLIHGTHCQKEARDIICFISC